MAIHYRPHFFQLCIKRVSYSVKHSSILLSSYKEVSKCPPLTLLFNHSFYNMGMSICMSVILVKDVDEGGEEDRLLVSGFINEEGNVFIVGPCRPPLLSSAVPPGAAAYDTVHMWVCVGLEQALAQSGSQQSVFNRAFPPGCQPASSPNGTTAQLTLPQPCQHKPCL